MNTLEFEVNGQVLRRIDSQDVVNENKHMYKCKFTFNENEEWIDLNKFVLFTDGWGNTATQHLGKSSNILSCLVPDSVLHGSYFKISVYAGDLITTNNVSVSLIQSGYKRNHHHHNCNNYKDIWVEIFDRLDNCIDSIVYDKNNLYLFNRDNLMESIALPFLNEDEVRDLVNDLVEDFISSNGVLSEEDREKFDSIEYGANKTIIDDTLDAESTNAISNKCVSEALQGKEDTYDVVERLNNIVIDLINNGE